MNVDPRLYAVAIVLAVWLLALWFYEGARRRLPSTEGRARSFDLASGLWWMGALLAAGGPVLIGVLLALVPVSEGDLGIMLSISALLGGVGPVLGYAILRGRIRVDDGGLWGFDLWGRAAYIPWACMRRLELRHEALHFIGATGAVYVPLQLEQWPAFLAEVERRLPHLPLPAELAPGHRLRDDGERLAFEIHWQGLYDHAGKLFGIAGLVFAATLPWLAPHPPGLLVAATGGLGLAFYPIMRRLVAKPRRYSATIGNTLQFLGLALFAFCVNHAHDLYVAHLGGEAALGGVLWLTMLGQTLAPPILAMAGAIWLAKWRWPERYARKRMAGDDG